MVYFVNELRKLSDYPEGATDKERKKRTRTEIDDLRDLVNGILEIQVSTADVTNPPTDAELDAEFGTPGAVGAGYVALLDDNNGDANVYLVFSSGTSWWYVALTKAV